MSLSWRLLISYIVIIVIALTLAFATLLLIARPIQNRLSIVRLTTQSRLASRQIDAMIERGATLDQIVQRLAQRPLDGNAHLLLVNKSTGNILADTKGQWAGQSITVPATDQGSSSSGTFAGPSDGNLNYAAAPISISDSSYVMAISPRQNAVPQILSELGWGFVLAGFVALLVSVLASAIIARSFAQPLKRIAGAATAVAAGNYDHRIPETGPPEVKRVAASFNAMAGQVSASQQATRDFVSNVSHELKTPLTSIQGFSQALMEGATHDEAAQRKAATIIHQEAARMTRLVEDLLDLARIDSGQVVMQRTTLDVAQILSGTFNRLLPQAHKKQVKLVKQWDKLPIIMGDGDRLAQVFTNLLDNAIRHTPAGGQVTISGKVARGLPKPRQAGSEPVSASVSTALSERGDFVQIGIGDTGPGIPPEDLARIFERFYQVDKSRKRGVGTGLGLAIIKEIIDAHGGHIRAESVEGVGTKFTVLLPINESSERTLISRK